MAVKRILCCDRCEREIKLNFFPKINIKMRYQIQFSHNSYNFLENEIILCSDCSKAFQRFMDEKE